MSWKFKEHGMLHAKKENNILVVEGTGPWNIEMLDNSGVKAQQILHELSQDFWGALTIMHGEAVYLPDASERLIEIVKQQKSLKRVATAIIVADSSLPAFSQGYLSGIYEKAGEEFAFFEHKVDAIKWLEQRIGLASKVEL